MPEGFLHKVFNDPELKERWDKLRINIDSKFMREMLSDRPLLNHKNSEVLSQSRHISDDHIPDGLLSSMERFLQEEKNYKYKSPKWKTIMNEEKSNNKTNVNVEAKEGALEITHRYGDAPVIQEPLPVSITGTIEAPGDYFEQRLEEKIIDPTKAHLLVDKLDGRITLNCDPASPLGTIVRGALVLNPKLARMNINKYGEHKLPEDGFLLLIKQSRPLFTSQTDAINLIDKVQNLDLKIDKEIKKSDNNRGNESRVYTQVCKDNLPDGFELEVPIFSGTKETMETHTFWVEIKFVYKDQLYFWLESLALEEIIEDLTEKLFEKEIERFEEDIPVIYT